MAVVVRRRGSVCLGLTRGGIGVSGRLRLPSSDCLAWAVGRRRLAGGRAARWCCIRLCLVGEIRQFGYGFRFYLVISV